ncbi:hypothetical protein F4781DRAFT_436163 [Annulohypoxylon bovei var. microspora]|nr:hypothetical protein F4781DRAFT_436163 [Annulohypoxylon bovei var. microspora]
MQLITFIIMASSLVAAAPSADIFLLGSYKRGNNLCGLTNYPKVTEGPIGDGIKYLRKGGSNAKCANANTCKLVSCSYGTGISICAGDSQYCIDSVDIGDAVNNLYAFCGYEGFNGGNVIPAMQVFQQDNNNIIVEGHKC